MTLIEEIQAAGIADGFNSPWTGPYAMQQSPEEFAMLIDALHGRKIDSYLQIGSAAGGSERFICEKCKVKNLFIVDMGDHPEFPTWRDLNKPALENKCVSVVEFIGDSHSDEAEVFVKSIGKMDLIGIDGDHTPAGAAMDWELIVPALRPGTLVWLHDTCTANMRACDAGAGEVFAKLKERHKVLLDVQDVFGIGLVEII